MAGNTANVLIGLNTAEGMSIPDDVRYAHIHLGNQLGTIVIHNKEAAQKLAELALHCMARLMYEEKINGTRMAAKTPEE